MSFFENPKILLKKTLVLEGCDENALIFIFRKIICDQLLFLKNSEKYLERNMLSLSIIPYNTIDVPKNPQNIFMSNM